MLKTIISGSQTGTDRAGLDVGNNGARCLCDKPNIKWNKGRGKDVKSALYISHQKRPHQWPSSIAGWEKGCNKSSV